MAISTLELIISIAAGVNVYGAAMRANNYFAPTPCGNEITAALVAVEMANERDKGVKMFKFKFHSSGTFYTSIPENYRNLTKSPALFALDIKYLHNYWCKVVYRSQK